MTTKLKYCLLVFLSCCITNLLAQSNKRIDIALFEKNKDIDNRYTYTSINEYGDSIEVLIFKSNQGQYTQIDKLLNTPLSRRYDFYPNSNNLKIEQELLFNSPVGVTKIYSENGDLLEEQDEDAPYLLSWQDILDIVKKELAIEPFIDLEKTCRSISRIKNKRSMYYITYQIGDFGSMGVSGIPMSKITISGDNGEIIASQKGNIDKIEKYPLNELPTKQEIKQGKELKKKLLEYRQSSNYKQTWRNWIPDTYSKKYNEDLRRETMKK